VRFKVRIDGLGIVCEDLGVSTCKFGPVKSATTYRGEITALNTGGASPLIGVSSIEFTTGKLISALDQFLLEQAAKEKEKVELAKIDAITDVPSLLKTNGAFAHHRIRCRI